MVIMKNRMYQSSQFVACVMTDITIFMSYVYNGNTSYTVKSLIYVAPNSKA